MSRSALAIAVAAALATPGSALAQDLRTPDARDAGQVRVAPAADLRSPDARAVPQPVAPVTAGDRDGTDLTLPIAGGGVALLLGALGGAVVLGRQRVTTAVGS